MVAVEDVVFTPVRPAQLATETGLAAPLAVARVRVVEERVLDVREKVCRLVGKLAQLPDELQALRVWFFFHFRTRALFFFAQLLDALLALCVRLFVAYERRAHVFFAVVKDLVQHGKVPAQVLRRKIQPGRTGPSRNLRLGQRLQEPHKEFEPELWASAVAKILCVIVPITLPLALPITLPLALPLALPGALSFCTACRSARDSGHLGPRGKRHGEPGTLKFGDEGVEPVFLCRRSTLFGVASTCHVFMSTGHLWEPDKKYTGNKKIHTVVTHGPRCAKLQICCLCVRRRKPVMV
jgi:hypothetical protein